MPSPRQRSDNDDDANDEEENAGNTLSFTTSSRPRRKRTRYAVPRQKYPFLCRTLGEPSLGCATSAPTTFEIFWINERGSLSCRTETRGDHKCPFCGHSAGSAKRLLKHCRRFHSDHHFFISVKTDDDALYIHAKPIHLADAGTLANPRNYQFFRFRPSTASGERVKMKPYSIDVVSDSIRSLLNKEQQAIASSPAQAPLRQYYHSRSRVPMQPGEWAVDSDDESESEWLDVLGQAGLHEFVDITEEEKRFLDLWKRFIRTDVVVVDEVIPGKCIEFIRSHRCELDGLRQQLLQHLMVFWENKLMPSSHILTCMEEYDALNSRGGETTTAWK